VSVRIVTDSTADLTPELLKQYGITFVPLNVRFGEETFKDGVTLGCADFYTRLVDARVTPTTSLPAPADFQAVYAELTGQDAEVISIHLSSELSGTFVSARTAAAEFPGCVQVIDSGHVSGSLLLLVLGAARMAAGGAAAAEIVKWVEEAKTRAQIYFIVDTLEYLQRSGRIGRAGHLIGSLLDMRHILTLKDGVIDACAKVRTRRKALERAMELIESGNVAPKEVAVCHAHAREDGELFMKKVEERFPQATRYFTEMGPVVGTNAGPGCIAVAAL
jgi:DegV family protein with EDD domain